MATTNSSEADALSEGLNARVIVGREGIGFTDTC